MDRRNVDNHAVAFLQLRQQRLAEKVRRAHVDRVEQVKLLDDVDPAVRYWAVVGLLALGDKAADAADALRARLADTAPAVRIEAAWALSGLDHGDKALAVLLRELEGDNPHARIRAARALQMLGEKTRSGRESINRAFQDCERALADHWRNKTDEKYDRYVWCALGPAVKALAK